MDIRLIPARQGDFSLVLELLNKAALRLQRKGLNQWQNWLNPTKDDIAWIQEGFEVQEFFFIKNEEEVLGVIRIMNEDLLYWGKQVEKALYIHSLTILSKYAGKGIGQAVIGQVGELASSKGCKWLRLDCNAENPALCNYYEQQGFKQLGVRVFEEFSCNLYQRKV